MDEAFPAMSEESIKTRLWRMQSIPVHPSARDGIEKVRGSTPLISTIPEVRFAQWNQGRDAFFVFLNPFLGWMAYGWRNRTKQGTKTPR